MGWLRGQNDWALVNMTITSFSKGDRMQGHNDPARVLQELGLNERVQHVLKGLREGVVVTLQDTTVIFANTSFSNLSGIPLEKLLLQKLSSLLPGSPTERALGNGTAHTPRERSQPALEGMADNVYLLPDQDQVKGALTVYAPQDHPFWGQSSRTSVQAYLDSRHALNTGLPAPFTRLIGEDRSFKQALFLAYKASMGDFPALIVGESGVGKELLVRAIHESSSRRRHEFVPINCAAIPNTLIESELFGYESGTFTGARRQGKKGLFDQAHQGTLFFDEIGDLELNTQAKILRVLEEKSFRRVGGEKHIPADIRLLSATNKNLEAMVLDGRFREDLYYRLNTMIVRLPPLRERGDDLRLLVAHLLEIFCRHYNKATRFSQKAVDILSRHDWPGNVRELRSVVEYAVNMADTATITPGDLPHYLLLSQTQASLQSKLPMHARNLRPSAQPSLYKEVMNAFERDLLQVVMDRCATRTQAMNMLGLSRRAFYQKLQKHGLLS